MGTISLRLNSQEDQFDYEIGVKTLEELENAPNPVTYSIEEAATELGIAL